MTCDQTTGSKDMGAAAAQLRGPAGGSSGGGVGGAPVQQQYRPPEPVLVLEAVEVRILHDLLRHRNQRDGAALSNLPTCHLFGCGRDTDPSEPPRRRGANVHLGRRWSSRVLCKASSCICSFCILKDPKRVHSLCIL